MESILQEWRKTFFNRFGRPNEQWTPEMFDWETFSFEHALYIEADLAREAYGKLQNDQGFFILIDSRSRRIAFETRDGPLPPISLLECWKDAEGGLIELYVIGLNMSWTFVLTHEGDYVGPYFSKRKWQKEDGMKQMRLDLERWGIAATTQ